MTYDWLELHKQAHAEFGRRVSAITDWDAPTPDTEWNVRDLVRHVIVEQQWVLPLLKGLTIDEAQATIAPLCDDLVGEWRRYSWLATQAWQSTPAEAPVHLSYGMVTAAGYLREVVSDVTIHSWDLARAVSTDELLDDELVEAVWTVFEPQKDMLAASGLYAPAVPMAKNAPLQSRLLALTGRDDRR